jgi:tetratricopeptide (TPR) repeat protein
MANKQTENKVSIEDFDIDSFREQATGFFERYKNIVYGVLFGLILLIGGLYAYFFMYKGPREKKAEEEVFRAEYYFSIDSFNLALKGREIPGQQGNFIGLLDVIDQYSGTSAANRATLMAGISLLQTGKFQEAKKYVENFSSSDKLMQSTAYGLLGDIYSELNDLDQAFSYYMKAADYFPNKATSPIHLRKAALLMGDMKKKNDEAIKIFERILKEYPQAAQRYFVEKDIVRLGGK